ncbi:hypothetical protein JOB18_004432 [Solea senegalensis]|uniref:Uncharacterized protein n=1 Tax=Solea senegalensis TaxID=28829 RepID=A0AAV6QY72_SOLSE|nr:hypothetical protein JOB18_004432 [Solea senegalensis]
MEECTQMFSITVCRPSLAWLPHDGCYDGATLCSAAAKDVHKDAARSPLAWKTYIRNQSDCSKISDAEQIRVHSFCSCLHLSVHQGATGIGCLALSWDLNRQPSSYEPNSFPLGHMAAL